MKQSFAHLRTTTPNLRVFLEAPMIALPVKVWGLMDVG